MPAFSIDPSHTHITLLGNWSIQNATQIESETKTIQLTKQPITIDAQQLTLLDTAGALCLLRLLKKSEQPFTKHLFVGLKPKDAALLHFIDARFKHESTPPIPIVSFQQMLARMGEAIVRFAHKTKIFLEFIGLIQVTIFHTIIGKRKLRLTSTVFHMEQVGLDAVPIITLLTFLIGAVVAFLGANILRDFGAEVFTVELVAISYLREFGVLLTAILLAGRSGSAFTAQIGSMKSKEEIDAIEALGLDVIELLVIPRLFALLIMLPILAFIACISGILGGAMVGIMALDITPGMFLSRLHETVEIRHFFVGLIKAPIFAFLIATVGCLEGLQVTGSAESVGKHTTASVVQAIFLVIVFDAIFAILFRELNI